MFLALLAVVYIYNGHYADKTIRNINQTAKEVKELQYEYKTVKSEVMFRSKQSELAKAVEPLGLKELTNRTGSVESYNTVTEDNECKLAELILQNNNQLKTSRQLGHMEVRA